MMADLYKNSLKLFKRFYWEKSKLSFLAMSETLDCQEQMLTLTFVLASLPELKADGSKSLRYKSGTLNYAREKATA